MRTQNTESQENILATIQPTEAFSYSSQTVYHEMDAVPVRDVNVLEQLQANMKTLKDLQSRMNFMMREIRYVMKA